jgi:hypothetical protein
MAIELNFFNLSGSINLTYRTNLNTLQDNPCTLLSSKFPGNNSQYAFPVAFGMPNKQVPTTLGGLILFAKEQGLKLVAIDTALQTTTVLVNLNPLYYGNYYGVNGLGFDNIYNGLTPNF